MHLRRNGRALIWLWLWLCSVNAAAHYMINLNKAQRLLGEIQKRQVMYITAAQHFDKMNNSKYAGRPYLGRVAIQQSTRVLIARRIGLVDLARSTYALALKLLPLFFSSGWPTAAAPNSSPAAASAASALPVARPPWSARHSPPVRTRSPACRCFRLARPCLHALARVPLPVRLRP